jgi:hypothetical protein
MYIFAFINHLKIKLFLELNVEYPFFQGFFFEKLRITHFLLIEVMDYPCLVGVIFHSVHNHVYV